MGQDKEKLRALLKFIEDLSVEPGNKWFVDELRARLEKTKKERINDQINTSRIKKIEEYLALDNSLDAYIPKINYSFVKDKTCKELLESDYRELLRYRLGLRGHKVDFKEFCRYAILQIEMLLNYYYSSKHNNNIDEIKTHLLKYNPRAELSNIFSFEKITLATKIWAFSKEMDIKGDTMDYLREVRNIQSHRGVTPKKIEVDETVKTMLTKHGIPLNSNGSVNYYLLYYSGRFDSEKEYFEANINNYQAKDKDIRNNRQRFYNYSFAIWYNEEPYYEVFSLLKLVTEKISKNL